MPKSQLAAQGPKGRRWGMRIDNPEFRPGNLIWWDGIDWGREPMQRYFRTFMEQLVWLRRRAKAACAVR